MGCVMSASIFFKAKSEHERHRNGKNYPIAAHCDDSSSFRFQGTERVMSQDRGGDLVEILDRREAYWMFTLQT